MRLNRRTNRNRGAGVRPGPQRVVLRPREAAAGTKPPVRIFVGTEPGQSRAERVFVWSVEQVRDRSRTYEIYLMKDLVGFDRRRWLTGFTNYRFAIPHLAGAAGRAIYNDVDQVYLADPAALFDADMGGHGYLALSPQDTAVMLIDCARMAPVWPLDVVRAERRKAIEARAAAVPGLWGRLPGEWHARDWEYERGRTKVLHFTTIHTQPWQPFPGAFAYQPNPNGYVWDDLERSADAAGFHVFTAESPSDEYAAVIGRLRAAPATARAAVPDASDLADLLAQAGARSVLDYTVGVRDDETDAAALASTYGGRVIQRADPAVAGRELLPPEPADAVVCRAGLERVPADDVAWAVDALAGRARRLLYAVVADERREEPLRDGTTLRTEARGRTWWASRFAAASARHPRVFCRLVFTEGGQVAYVREWGPRVSGEPRVWILGDDKAGHTTQSVGLAEALGCAYDVKALRFSLLNRLSNHVLGASRLGLDRRRSAPLVPPWPDAVISTGRRTAPVARWIAKQSRGRTRTVHLGRKGGEAPDGFDAVVSCAHFRLPPHPRRIETAAPLTAVTRAGLAAAGRRWQGLFGDAPSPHVVLVVGGTTAQHRLDAGAARRLGTDVRAFAEAAGGSVFAITSPRTGTEATEALAEALGARHHVHRWRPGERDNPYLGYLALADVLVVTGESESMLAEAAATGTPLYIYPLPVKPPGLRARLRGWVLARAGAQPRKRKGTVRPQQGLEYYCARLIERGLVRPERDVERLHARLIELGIAQPFGAPLRRDGGAVLDEIGAVAGRVRGLLGLLAPEAAAGRADAGDPDGRRASAG
jgi:mitochondrial fission protein ELM1